MATVNIEKVKGNSYKEREQSKNIEKKNVQKVITGDAKRSGGISKLRFGSLIFPNDGKNIRNYLITDVIIPSIKDLLTDMVTKGINMLLYGEDRSSKRKSPFGTTSYISYNSISQSKPSRTASTSAVLSDDIIIESREEAEDVLSTLCDIISTYGTTSVADLYECVGFTPEHTDYKYGWTNLSAASVVRTREGYLIKLPKAKPLD